MTKSRTLRKAGAVVLSLAMAFSVAGVAPSADAAAKKPALSAKKGTIKVGKTKKVTIKNTTKKKVKKLVVSSSNKKVATVKKNNKVKFTVTGKTAGTAKITAKVTLKKAVAKKKVYTLKYTATVKKATVVTPTEDPSAPTATPAELALEKVEPAVAGSFNIVIAYFNTAVDSIDPSEVQIRNVATNQLYSIEKVVMAADKKSATMTLTGTSSSGANNTYLVANVDYKMIVTKNGKTAEKVFTIPQVAGDAVVVEANATDKTIGLDIIKNANGTNGIDGAADVTLTDKNGLITDYFDILGKTVTAQYDKNRVLIGLTVSDSTVLEGFMKYNGATANSYTIGETTFKLGADGGNGSSIYANTIVAATQTKLGTYAATNNAVWARVTLNGDGTSRSIVAMQGYTDTFFVAAVDGTIIKNGSNELNLKEYTIIKDGKKVDTTAISANDVVFYTAGGTKAALVYTNSIKGKVTKELGTKFELDGKQYAYPSDVPTALKSSDESTWTAARINDLKTAGTEVTVYTDPSGQAVYLVGEAAASTKTVTLVLTGVSNSQSGDAIDPVDKIAGIDIDTNKPATYSFSTKGFDKTKMDSYTASATGTRADYTIANLAAGDVVELTVKESDGSVTAINELGTIKDGATIAASATGLFYDGKQGDDLTSPAIFTKTITNSVKNIGSGASTGLSTSGIKIIVVNDANPANVKSVQVVSWADWKGSLLITSADEKAAAGVLTGCQVLGSKGSAATSIKYIVTNKTAQSNVSTSTDTTTFTGFVHGVLNGNDKSITVLSGDTTLSGEYTKFAGDTIPSAITTNKDGFYSLTIVKGTKEVSAATYIGKAGTTDFTWATTSEGEVTVDSAATSKLFVAGTKTGKITVSKDDPSAAGYTTSAGDVEITVDKGALIVKKTATGYEIPDDGISSLTTGSVIYVHKTAGTATNVDLVYIYSVK